MVKDESRMGTKAIALMSGGLDSSLAVRLATDMGLEILGVHFTGPFCQCNRGTDCELHYAKQQADAAGIPFKIVPLGKEYLNIVANPPHGYGSGVNPCIDCRIMMFRKAKEYMLANGAFFIITGEVLGQRPMSQLRDKLRIIERESGLDGLIVRPLCAQHMPETIAEQDGLIDRSKLLSIQGRGRREQIELASSLAIGDYPCPAGGCLLTDKHFAARVRDVLKHEGLALGDISLLKIGRHFRLADGSKLIVGRNEAENSKIESLSRNGNIVLTPVDGPGPTSLLRSTAKTGDSVALAGTIVASYCKASAPLTISATHNGTVRTISCQKMESEDRDHQQILAGPRNG
jgi:tRNA U34 2-thiouridine synthase MnmA/TrmU